MATLLLARTAIRAREMAVRSALGGSRWRISEQLLIECLLLGLLGGFLGLILSFWGVGFLRSVLNFNDFVRTIEPSIDWRVLLFTVAASLLTVLLFGLRPIFQMANPSVQTALKEGTRGGSSQPLRTKTRNALVTAEVALAIFLLIGAGLMIDSLIAEMRDNLGFSANHVIAAQLVLSRRQYDTSAKQARFYHHLLQGLRSLAGTISVGVSASLPATGSTGRVDFDPEKSSSGQARHDKARLYTVSPGYLRAMEIPLLKGRDFDESDSDDAMPVVLVNQAFVKHFYPGGEPIGAYIRISQDEAVQSPWREIVGIVGNVKDFMGQPVNEPQIYTDFFQSPQLNMSVVVRARLEPAAFAHSFRQTVWSIDKSQPIEQIAPMTQVLDAAAAGDRLFSELLGVFALMALVLASVGIYGNISYSVTQRTQEIGLRVALGAERTEVLRLVITNVMFMTAVGLAIGLAVAAFLPGLLKGMFVGLIIPPNVLAVFIAVAGLISIVSILPSYFPVRRAMKVDPMVALRYE